MILEKEITIQINSPYIIPHYKNLGYNIKYKDVITVPIEHLPKSSHIKITAVCSKCGNKKKIMYKTYNIATDNNYMCIKCSKEKKNKTMLELYGCEHALQCDKFTNKKIETWKNKYGVDHPMKNKDIRKKHISTMIELYGTKHALCNNEILTNMLNKQIEEYGMLYVQTEEYKEKNINTCLKKYNSAYYMATEQFRKKSKETVINKYGVEYITQNYEIFEKILKSGKKIHKYKNTNLYYQGSYEKDFLDLCEKLNILNIIKRGVSVHYTFQNKDLIYFPDFIIEDKNTIIEIKSNYWYKVHESKNIIKKDTCEKLGFNYIMILNKDYSEFLKLIYQHS